MTTRSRISTADSKKPSRKRSGSSANTPTFQTGGDSWRPATFAGRSFLKRVRSDDAPYRLFAPDSSVLIACSGGPDSVALLHIFLALRTKLRLRLGVAHVNYGLRGTDSRLDEALVRDLCTHYGLPCHVIRPKGTSTTNEETLRDTRYRFFGRVMKRHGFDAVALAHTRDEQAETVLIRLFRGAGPNGLSGMKRRHDSLIRPLLGTRKREILEFLSSEGLPFREDASNRDVSILRNRIRHELLPLLDRDYRRGITEVLARTAEVFAADLESRDVTHASPRFVMVRDGVAFSRDAYRALSETDRYSNLRSLFCQVSATRRPPAFSFVRAVDRLIGEDSPKARTYASKRLKITVRGDRVTMIRTDT